MTFQRVDLTRPDLTWQLTINTRKINKYKVKVSTFKHLGIHALHCVSTLEGTDLTAATFQISIYQYPSTIKSENKRPTFQSNPPTKTNIQHTPQPYMHTHYSYIV